MNRPFDSFLEYKHAEDYHGTKDAMPDSFDRWVEEKDGAELIDLANEALVAAIASVELLLPLAKGYYDRHADVESTGRFIREAEELVRSGYVFNGSPAMDPLYEAARTAVIEEQEASAGLLQRKLKIGYARSASLLDQLEENGVISPSEGMIRPRKVLVQKG